MITLNPSIPSMPRLLVLAAMCAGPLGLSACDAMNLQGGRLGQPAQGGTNPLAAQDGYFQVGDPYSELQGSALEGHRWKTCKRLYRYLLEPGESGKGQTSYDGALRGYVQPLIEQGKLPADRFYVGVQSKAMLVSVPAGERQDLAKNMEAEQVCIWADGKLDKFPCPDKPTDLTCAIFHARLDKWQGALSMSPGFGAAGPMAEDGGSVPTSTGPSGSTPPTPQ